MPLLYNNQVKTLHENIDNVFGEITSEEILEKHKKCFGEGSFFYNWYNGRIIILKPVMKSPIAFDINNHKELVTQYINQRKKTHHEVLFGPMKLFFDVDLKDGCNQKPDNEEEELNNFIAFVTDKVKKVLGIDSKCYVSSASGYSGEKYKLSYHLCFNVWFNKGGPAIKKFVDEHIIPECPLKLMKVDLNPYPSTFYKTTKSLRVVLSTKEDGSRRLDIVTRNSNIYDHLIRFRTKECTETNYGEYKFSKSAPSMIENIEYLSEIARMIHEHDSQLEQGEGNRVNRKGPSHCKICNAEHHSDNGYYSIGDNGEVRLHCFRANDHVTEGKKFVEIGKLRDYSVLDYQFSEVTPRKVWLKYIEPKHLDVAKRVHCCKSPMGTGKSTLVRSVMEKDKDASLLTIVPRISLAEQHVKQFGTVMYDDKKSKPDEAKRLTTTIHSLYKFYGTYDHVFIDESEAIVSALYSDQDLHMAEIRAALSQVLKYAKQVYVADCNLGKATIEILKQLGEMRDVEVIINSYKTGTDKKVYNYRNMDKWMNQLMDDIEKGEDIAIFCDSKRECQKIEKDIRDTFDGINVKLYTADDGNKKDLSDVNEALKDVDIAIFSPVVTVGTDITLDKFKKVYGLYKGKSINVFDQEQQLGRVRKMEEIHLFIKGKDQCKQVSFEEILKKEMNRKCKIETNFIDNLKELEKRHGTYTVSDARELLAEIDDFKARQDQHAQLFAQVEYLRRISRNTPSLLLDQFKRKGMDIVEVIERGHKEEIVKPLVDVKVDEEELQKIEDEAKKAVVEKLKGYYLYREGIEEYVTGEGAIKICANMNYLCNSSIDDLTSKQAEKVKRADYVGKLLNADVTYVKRVKMIETALGLDHFERMNKFDWKKEDLTKVVSKEANKALFDDLNTGTETEAKARTVWDLVMIRRRIYSEKLFKGYFDKKKKKLGNKEREEDLCQIPQEDLLEIEKIYTRTTKLLM